MKKALIIGMLLPLTAVAQVAPKMTIGQAVHETSVSAMDYSAKQKAALDLRINRVFSQGDIRIAPQQVIFGEVDVVLFQGLNKFLLKADVEKVATAQEKLSAAKALETKEQMDSQIQAIRDNVRNYDEVILDSKGTQVVIDMVMLDDAKTQIEALEKQIADIKITPSDSRSDAELIAQLKQKIAAIEVNPESYIHNQTQIPENAHIVRRNLKSTSQFDIERLEGKKSALVSAESKAASISAASKELSAAKGNILVKIGRGSVNSIVYAGKAIIAVQVVTRLYVMSDLSNVKNPGALPLLTLISGKSVSQYYEDAVNGLSNLMSEKLN